MNSDSYIRPYAPKAQPNKFFLFVEGKTDVEFLTIMMDKAPFEDTNIFLHWEIIQCGGKDGVLKRLQGNNPRYFGLVDRDAWDEKEMSAMLALYPNLFILPRFCIENYIISPDELLNAFPSLLPYYDQMKSQVPTGIRHGCLWRAATPLRQDLIKAGFIQALLKYPPVNDEELSKLIHRWQSVLSVEGVKSRASIFYKEIETLPQEEALHIFVHGKIFWKNVVEKNAEKIFPTFKREQLRKKILREIPLPKDLEEFLRKIFFSTVTE